MPPPVGVVTVVSPKNNKNRDNESKKRKATVVVSNSEPMRQRTMPGVLLQTQNKYLTFLSSTHDSGVDGNEAISTVDQLKNLKVMQDNLER